MTLTDIVVRNLTPEHKQRTYFDDNPRGFGIRVGPGGAKTFVLVCGAARERVTLGRYPTQDHPSRLKESRPGCST